MALEIEKPLPLQLGNRYMFTLTSYEPVDVEIVRMQVQDADIDDGIAQIMEMAGAAGQTPTDELVEELFGKEDVHTAEQLRKKVTDILATLAENSLEEQRFTGALDALAERLRERIPDEMIRGRAEQMVTTLAYELQQKGSSIDTLMTTDQVSREDLLAYASADAQIQLEQEQALIAFAAKRNITVEEKEFPALLGIPEDQLSEFVAAARRANSYDELHNAALAAKAGNVVAEEAKVTIVDETDEEAEARRAEKHEFLAAKHELEERLAGAGSKDSDGADAGSDTATSKGFKLV